MAKKFNWQLGPRVPNADDQAIGQTYLELYFRYQDPTMMAPTRQRMDAVMALPETRRSLCGGGAMRCLWRRRCSRN